MSGPSSAAPGGDRIGSRLGGYEIRGRLGSGGMGEVFRAHDMRLDRDVALKVLPLESAADPGRVRRFEREARAASALNHPNIVTVYEVGTAESVSYIAMELLEGRTLRELSSRGPLPWKEALDLGCQVAGGLAQAHEAGIVHRDLKPENVIVSKEGVAKILDFGLAKKMPFEGDAGSGETTLTHEGSIVGTVSYMSPEQAAGQRVSFPSDQFSFGSILYELLTGVRPYQKKTHVETLAAIINEEPEAIEKLNPGVPGPLCWIVERCLAKEPGRRYTSTQDLAQDLRSVGGHLAGPSTAFSFARSSASRRFLPGVLAALAVTVSFVAVFFAGKRTGDRPAPDFRRLSFGRGAVSSGRFTPDGRTIVYGAAWDGAPIRLFSTRTDARDSARLELSDADVVSVSSQSEIAVLLERPLEPIPEFTGTLARVPLAGGAPREMTEGVSGADWSPDGRSLAIARRVGETNRIEFPIGRVLYETSGFIETLRVSPGGDRVAFMVRNLNVSVETVDLAGKHSVVSDGWKRGSGLAWSADGSEIWFGANEGEWRTPLYAVSLSGKQRLLMRLPAWIKMLDVFRDGQVLVSLVSLRSTIFAKAPGDVRERDLSWHEGSIVKSLTPDGKTLLFDVGSEGHFHMIYVRPMDGSPAKRIGEGRSLAISPDGQWVAANTDARGSGLVLLPTGAGETRVLDTEGHRFEEGTFFPDGKEILLLATDPGHRKRSYVEDLRTGKLRPAAPEGVCCLVLSPDGKEMACEGPHEEGLIYPVEGGTPRPIPGFKPDEGEPQMWSSDGRSLFVGGPEVFRLDLATGKRELWQDFSPSDRAGLFTNLSSIAMTPDGKSYAYSFLYDLSDLYLVSGLK